MPHVLLIGTLDTKGPEIAYVRDRVRALGVGTIVADSGILGEPLDITPDVTRDEVARLGGTTIDALRQAGSRGKAVHGMLAGLRQLALDLFGQGRLQGVATLGGAEGAVALVLCRSLGGPPSPRRPSQPSMLPSAASSSPRDSPPSPRCCPPPPCRFRLRPSRAPDPAIPATGEY